MNREMNVTEKKKTDPSICLENTQWFDVLVLGSGIAGISAAIAASKEGMRVALACKGKLFSGSSFYPGTWGLGLIGPEQEDDQEDLIRSIETVGCGMADDSMVRAFVSGIRPAIEQVEQMGVKLRKAQAGADQKEYIPCFDHKHRAWNGIEFDSAREKFEEQLKAGNVTICPGFEALELVKTEGRVCGAVISNGTELHFLPAKSTVLATGGYGSLFQHHLCTSDVEGSGQGLAMDAGCRLINMEFMQIMAGYLSPAYGTIFNEKVFRFTHLEAQGEALLSHQPELFALRSGHGPFTSRLDSRAIDLAICAHPEGVTVRYDESLRMDPPEFVKTYFDWLKEAKGLTMDDPVRIGLFAHAANGGVRIDPDAFTGIPGLFAAGEVTGGMHGADRIGGLSTANGLVFGTKAGISAAKNAKAAPEPLSSWKFSTLGITDARKQFSELQAVMTEHAMAIRKEEGLKKALCKVQEIREHTKEPMESIRELTVSRRLDAQLKTATAILSAQLLRKESRGSHYREDYPLEHATYSKPILLKEDSDRIYAEILA